MSGRHELVEGWTEPIDFILRDGNQAPVDPTGSTVTLFLKKPSGVEISATLAIVDGPAGKVRWTPASSDDVQAGRSRLRIATDNSTRRTWYPSTEGPFVLDVGRRT